MTESPSHQGQSMLEAILNSAVGAIITIDSRGLMQIVNPATLRLFGYSELELIGRNVSMLMPEPHQSRHDQYITNFLKSGVGKIIGIGRAVEGRRKNGSTFPMHLSVSTFEISGQQYFAGIVHDLSARARLQAEVDHQSALFRAVFDHVPEALIITSMQHQIVSVNPAATRIFGYAGEELDGASSAKLFETPSDFERARDAIASLMVEKSTLPHTTTARFCRKNGKAFSGQIAVAIIRSADGHDVGILGLVRDLTLQLKQEETLLKTQRLEAIGQLTGGVAHDFNNLLTIITGNLELIDGWVDDERVRDHVRRATGAADAGARLTSRLLTFARRRRLEPQIVNLNDQVLSMTEILHRTIGENIQLSTVLAPNLWPVLIDPGEIENAIVNLTINARDAMPKGVSSS